MDTMAVDLIITHHTLLIKTSRFIPIAANQTMHASTDTLLLILGIEKWQQNKTDKIG